MFSETHPYTFSELCNKFKKFQVPAFQRAYTWSSRQINDLWDSLINNEKEYFIGNIVCLEPSVDSDERLVIIDGQQRLFTISLILAAIRDEYGFIKTKNKDDRDRIKKYKQIINEILYYREIKFPFKEELRLYPGKRNLEDIYNKIIEGKINFQDKKNLENLDDNQKKYVTNYKNIRRLIKKYTENNSFDKLEELVEKTTSLLFIAIVCRSDSDAYKIFEGLNATGIGLSVVDLVKNAVLRSVKGEEAKNLVEENWERIETVFEETKISKFPKFLRHQWISRWGYITTSKLFDKIKEIRLKNKNNSDIIEYTKEVLEDAKAYSAFINEKDESFLKKKKIPNSSIENIIKFRFLDIEQVYELILSYYNKFLKSGGSFTENQFNNLLNRLWIFSFRASVIGVNPSEYEKIFADHCQYITEYRSNKFDRMSEDFFKELKKIVSNDDDFIDNFASNLNYKNNKNLIHYLLDEIMRSFNPNIKVAFPTIEHILPQDPTEWDMKKYDVKDFVNDIGNLTLLYDKDNKKLQNAKMETKTKKVFSKSAFKLNNELVKMQKEFKNNPREAITKRGIKLGKIANKIWNLN